MNLSVDILQVEIEVSIFFFFYQKYAVQYATVAELVERADKDTDPICNWCLSGHHSSGSNVSAVWQIPTLNSGLMSILVRSEH